MKIVRIYINDQNARIEVTNEAIKLNKNNNTSGSFYYTSNYIDKHKDEIKKIFKSINIKNVTYKDEVSFWITYDLFDCKNYYFDFSSSLSLLSMNLLLDKDNVNNIYLYYQIIFH